MENESFVVLTVAATNYLPKACVLAESLRVHHPRAKVVLCLVERRMPDDLASGTEFDQVILASELDYDNVDAFLFRHKLLEATTAIKARLLKELMRRFPAENRFIYLDPDIQVYGPFIELMDVMNRKDIVVTPHHLEDETTEEGIRDNVLRTLQCGIFNLGFLGLRRSAEAARFLDWWDSRLEMMCYVDFTHGLFVDQKWVDLAVSFFDMHVLREVGYNVANWNISCRQISLHDGQYFAAGKPLRFFHYSGIDVGKDKRIFKRYGGSEDRPVHWMREDYKRLVKNSRFASLRFAPWSYDYFDSGERIADLARISCRHNKELLKTYQSPFSESNEMFVSQGW